MMRNAIRRNDSCDVSSVSPLSEQASFSLAGGFLLSGETGEEDMLGSSGLSLLLRALTSQ